MRSMKLKISSSGEDSTALRQALVLGFFPHAARRQQGTTYRVLSSGQEVTIHPSSVLARAGTARSGQVPIEAIVFGELVATTRLYARDVTAIDINWLPQLVPAFFARTEKAG